MIYKTICYAFIKPMITASKLVFLVLRNFIICKTKINNTSYINYNPLSLLYKEEFPKDLD